MPVPPNMSMVLSDKELDFIERFYEGKSAAVHAALERMMVTYDYTVIEDNGGGLHLFLFHPGSETPAMGFTGFEYNPGHLLMAIDALDAGDNPADWDGHMEDPAADWASIHSYEFGHEVICYGENGKRTLWPDRMGRAGHIEFGIEDE